MSGARGLPQAQCPSPQVLICGSEEWDPIYFGASG